MTGHAVESSKKKEGPTKAQSQSYITNPPTDAVVGRAGGNWRNPREHCPPREMVVVSDDLMNIIPQVNELMKNYQQVLTLRAACKTHKEIREKRLITACGTLGAVLNDIRCFFKVLASRPVDPRSHLFDAQSPIILELLKESVALRDVLNHPVFDSPQFMELCTMVKHSENRSVLEISEREQVNEQYRHLATGLNLVLARTDVLLSRSDDRARMRSNTSPMAMNDSSDEQNQEEAFIDLPPSPIEDTLAGSLQQRKRRRAIEQDIVLASEVRTSNTPRPILSGVDNNHKTYRSFIEDYIYKWRPNEVNYGQEWRVDKPVTVRLVDGTTAVKKSNTRAAWYNVRRPMYEFFEVAYEEGLTKALTIDDIIEQGEEIYRSAIVSGKQERPRLQDVKRQFIAALKNMGIRGERACIGARASILLDAVTNALDILNNGGTPIGGDTTRQDDQPDETV
jgi:hypothetical protein